jgi:hypothetical protein
MLTVHAGHGDYLGIYGGVFALGSSNHLVPIYILVSLLLIRRAIRDIILRLAGQRTCLTAYTLVQVNDHSPLWHL